MRDDTGTCSSSGFTMKTSSWWGGGGAGGKIEAVHLRVVYILIRRYSCADEGKNVGTGMQLCVCVTIELKFSLCTPLHKTATPKDGKTVTIATRDSLQHILHLFSILVVRGITLYISGEIRQRKSKAYRRGARGKKGGGGVK
jgi:hypothetical protein